MNLAGRGQDHRARGGNSAVTGKNEPVRFRFRRPQTSLLIASLIIACCLVGVGYAVSLSVTGKARLGLPATIEEIDPVREATQVPAQTQVFVDLKSGYTGVLVIDGLELQTVNLDDLRDPKNPGRQISVPPVTTYEAGNATLTFHPSDDAPIKEFTEGQHVVQVIFWKVTENRASARSYSWTFNVF